MYIIKIVAALSEGDLHVWSIALERDAGEVARLEPLLPSIERERARRFRFDRDRQHYLAAHTILRKLLARYLPSSAPPIDFEYGAEGKPEIPGRPLRFNLSHSSALALAAFTRSREIGVDVERVRETVDDEQIARRFFSPAETAALLALPKAERDAAFFRIWTRKEAYVKARGGGLSIPLHSFDVSLDAGKAELLRAPDRERWRMFSLDAPPGYCAAAVAEAGIERVSTFTI